MRLALSRVLCLGLVSLFASSVSFAQLVSPQPLITQPINESQVIALRGNTHPLAQPQFDIGPAPGNLSMQRMLLVLKRDPQQEFALHKLLDDQQDQASPNYHKWLTPDEFGAQFGPSDQDLQLVSGWLQTHGFQVNRITHGRSVIEFSGFESQVEQAFHTQIHQYSVNGQVHWANASDPQIPAALAPAVAGFRSLHNFPAHPMLRVLGPVSRDKSTGQITPLQPVAQANSPRPLFTLPVGTGNFCGVQPGYCYGVGPYDFATIYNELPLWNGSPAIDGSGETIAIIGETDINPQDVTDFRNFFGLLPGTLNIIHDGPAPGILSNGEETESDLDVEWSGAVAKGATIDFVVAETTETTWGIDLAALHVIDQNLAPVMSESYGVCELGLGPAGNQFYSSLWAQAAAQGITVMLSAGDGGSAGCDDFNRSGPATFGLQVSGFASTPFNVAVGGTDFYDLTNPAPYWSKTNNSTTHASALKYIPETTWDDSCTNPIFSTLGFSTNAETNCNDPQIVGAGFVNIVGGSGGKSNCTQSDGVHPASCSNGYPKPSWQVAPGVPTDGVRDLPDVSLFAASGSPSGSFYILCEADQVPVSATSCNPSDPATWFFAIGGTSASSPAFAGVMALVNQKVHAPQGIANYVLYKLAAQQSASSCNSTNGSGANCVFNDITTGTIAMPCQVSSPDCTVKTAGHQYGILNGYSTGTGYDLATGLGSVNVANLVNKWSSVTFRATNTTLSLSPTSSLTHGQSVNVTASITPGTGTTPPTPSGTISLMTSSGAPAGNFTLNNAGAVSASTNLLPGGSYSVTAHYGGDATYGGSNSSPVNITVGKENSSAQIDLQTFDWQGNLISSHASTAVYGSPSILRVDVLNSAGNPCQVNNVQQSGCPTGTVNLTANGTPFGNSAFGLNSLGYTEDQFPILPGGSDSVKAQYAGDASFNPSSTTRVLSITPAPTNVSSNLNGSTVGANYSALVIVQSQSFGASPTGTVTFYANGKAIPGTVTYSSDNRSAPTIYYLANFTSSSSPFPTPGNYAITGSYSGDANYQPGPFNSGTLFVQFAAPVINLQGSPNPVNAGSSTKLVATVLGASPTIAPTGTIGFGETTTGGLPGTVSYSTITDPNTGNLDLQGKLTISPAFTDGYIASYSGDFNYQPTWFTNPTIVTVSGNDFTLTAPGNGAIVQPGNSGQFQLFVGFQSSTAPVTFTCSGLPSESTCSASPNPISSLGNVFLQISTTAPNRSSTTNVSAHTSRYLWLSSMFPFAAILLIKYRRSGTQHALARLLLTFLLVLGIACGGGGSSGGGGGGGGGTSPGAPRNLTAAPVSSSQIDLNWTASAGATSYSVFRSTTSGFTPSASNQVTNGWNSTSLSDTGLLPSTAYFYVVKAVNGSGSSGPSNQASASTQAFDPGTPAGTYNITVTGTSGSGAGAISHSVNVTLVVQ